jgi:hypothetical protein
MSLDPCPQLDAALRKLAQRTGALCAAVRSADLSRVQEALDGRAEACEYLRTCAGHAGLMSTDNIAVLEAVIRQGDAAIRDLAARRDRARAALGELEAVRRWLARMAPPIPAPPSRINRTG